MATQNNKRTLHRKEWQMMTPAPANTAAGSFLVKDYISKKRSAFYCVSATVHYLYRVDEDAWIQIPSMALGGTFGAGACGVWSTWSNTLSATGGTTTTLTLTTNISGYCVGETIRFLTGSNTSSDVVVTGVKIIPGGNSTVTFTPAVSNAVANGDTFAVSTGMYYIWNAGTMSATSFKSYDPLTGVVTSLSVTSAPTAWATDGRLVATPSYVGSYSTGTATSATPTTIVCSTKSWTSSQWKNYQVRITSGTGKGQIRTITSNDSTSLTVAAWTVTPDTSSVFAIEANDDFLYLLGNNAVTLYRYSISGNSWSTLSPGTARGGAPGVGMSANWVGKTKDASWADETDILDGRFIYSFRGGATSTLDVYDIALNTWKNAIAYVGAQETFTTGSSYDECFDKIFMRQNSTHRFFYFKPVDNRIYPLNTLLYPDSTALLGEKIFSVIYTSESGDNDEIVWLYTLMNTGAVLHRLMVY